VFRGRRGVVGRPGMESPAPAQPLSSNRPLAQLQAGYRLLRQMPEVGRFVVAYLCFGDAISSVIALSSTFLTHQLFDDNASKASSFLFSLILMVQFVALGGALVFVRLARRVGAKRAILVNLATWFLLILFAYAVLRNKAEAVVMGLVLGLLLGGATALARSLFAQMIPRGNEATFFGLFEVCSQGTAWLAPLLFTVVVQVTGSFHQAILSLMVLFVAGFLLLLRVDPEAAAREASALGSAGRGANGDELG
jgi:UMF1 family MFS transporter